MLINHVRTADIDLVLQTGICYMRAGDSRGSLLVKQGFENMAYVLIHTNGESAHLFKVAKKGFQIWTAEQLQQLGFSAEHAPYYAVVRFDPNKEVLFDHLPLLKKRTQTTVTDIKPISEFIEII